jgi:hypothetical protein
MLILNVYVILAEGELLPNYFNTYRELLDKVKQVYKEWDDRFEEDGIVNKYSINKIEVEEGYNMNVTLGYPNLTELYIEKELFISIHRLVKNPEG